MNENQVAPEIERLKRIIQQRDRGHRLLNQQATKIQRENAKKLRDLLKIAHETRK